jgi:hypothetical protein
MNLDNVMVSVRASSLIVVTENHGGHMAGRCVACGQSGWLHTSGPNGIDHKQDCPITLALKEKEET